VANCHNLKRTSARTFKLSRDCEILEKLTDVVGLYLNPPQRRWCCVWMKRAKFKRWIARRGAATEEGPVRYDDA